MAITWSGWRVGGGNEYRTGVDITYSPATITPATSSVTVTVKSYMQSRWASNGGSDSWWLTSNKSISASNVGGWSWNTSAMQVLTITTQTESVPLSYSGTTAYSATSRVKDLGASSLDFSVTKSITLPKRPPQVPSDPVSATLTRVSDTQHNVSWVRPANAGNDSHRWEFTDIFRYSETLDTYALMVSLTGSPTSWSDTSTKANNRYRYRVRGRNATGVTNQVGSGSRSTTPAAPTNVVAQKVGTDIIVTWSEGHIYGDSVLQIQDNGTIVGEVGINIGEFTHENPNPAATHRYAVRARTPADESPQLSSSWSAWSNVVQLQAPPNPPTNLAPNGPVAEKKALGSVNLSWSHNPVDTTSQSAYEVEHRVAPSSTWTSTGKITTSNQFRNHNFSSVPSGAIIQWRVRTWGADPNPSAWSATASFPYASAPTVSIDGPVGTVTEPSALIDWTYFQEDGALQVSWAVELYDQAAPATRIYRATGLGSTSQHTTAPVLENGHSYNVRVQVRANNGLASMWYQSSFSVSFPPPVPPEVEVECLDSGAVAIRARAQDDGVAPDTDHLRILRSINGGPWVLLADDLGLDVEYLDWTGLTYGDNVYQVISVTAAGAVAHTEIVAECRNDCDIFLSGGPEFSVNVQLRYGTERTVHTGRSRVLNQFAGRSKPVETSGVSVPLSISVSAHTMPPNLCRGGNSQPDAIEALFALPGPHLYRDGTGRRIYCSLSALSIGQGFMAPVQFTVTEADPGTVAQQEFVMSEVGPVLVEVRPGEYTIYGGGVQSEIGPGEWTWVP